MKKIWAPWRSKYIYLRGNKKCIFCGNKSRERKGRYIVGRSVHSFAMLNLYPYNNGHVMVAPYRHVKGLESLSAAELEDMMSLVIKMKLKLDKKLEPQGYNIGINIGKIAGAGFAGHVHIHIVPRWAGDSNFMPLIADTKVVSESLNAMHRLLKAK